jgi:prenylated cyclic peptide (anacyclamide/piricyclamide family)
MTKKNLKPQQAAPVQREINTASSVGGTGLTPNIEPNPYIPTPPGGWKGQTIMNPETGLMVPFAGDDAE